MRNRNKKRRLVRGRIGGNTHQCARTLGCTSSGPRHPDKSHRFPISNFSDLINLTLFSRFWLCFGPLDYP
jgi:hypothetical protein